MKVTILKSIAASTVLAALSISLPLAAQEVPSANGGSIHYSLSTSAQALTTHVFQVTTTRGLGGSVSFGFGINDHGWVTGDSNLPDDQSEHGFVWAWRQGTVMDIGTLGGPNASSPGPSKDGFGRVMGHSLTGQVDPNHEIFCPFTYPVND